MDENHDCSDCSNARLIRRQQEVIKELGAELDAVKRVLGRMDKLGWVEAGPLEGGPVDATPRERGMLRYIGQMADMVDEALNAAERTK